MRKGKEIKGFNTKFVIKLSFLFSISRNQYIIYITVVFLVSFGRQNLLCIKEL